MATLSDEDLMELFQGGYMNAFNILVTRYKDRMHNFLYRYTKNHLDCEDIVQETFLRVFKSRNSYRRIARFSTWLYTIAINLAKSHHKKSQRMTTLSIHQDPSDDNDFEIELEDKNLTPDQSLHQKQCVEQVTKALEQISDDFREVVVLRDIQNLSYDEIAEITNLPMGTVKSRINRGRAQVQELMKNYVHAETETPVYS